MGVTNLFFELNWIKAKKSAILKRHGYHSNDKNVIFVKKNHALFIVTFIIQCYLLFQNVKIILKIHPISTVFLKSKSIGSHLKIDQHILLKNFISLKYIVP